MRANTSRVNIRTITPWRPGGFLAVTAAAVAAAVTLGGCAGSGGGPAGGVDLSGTCQFRACVCAPDDAPVWATGNTQPVRWRENGGAYCSPGFSLKLGSRRK